MITLADIRNPARKSGFDHVHLSASAQYPSSKPFQAASGGRYGPTDDGWRGPRRAEAARAAQDYCDYMNGQAATPQPQLKSAGHKRPQRRMTNDPHAERKRALRAELRRLEAELAEDRSGYVYLAIEVNPGGALTYGKIGYTTDLNSRIASLQTGNPRVLRMHLAKPGTEADEAALHAKYIQNNVLQEWFKITKELLLEWGPEHYIAVPSDEGAKVAA